MRIGRVEYDRLREAWVLQQPEVLKLFDAALDGVTASTCDNPVAFVTAGQAMKRRTQDLLSDSEALGLVRAAAQRFDDACASEGIEVYEPKDAGDGEDE